MSLRSAILMGLPLLGIAAGPSRADVFYAPQPWAAPAVPVAYAPAGYVQYAPAPVGYSVPVVAMTPLGLPTYQFLTYGPPVPAYRKMKVQYEWKSNGMWEVNYKWR